MCHPYLGEVSLGTLFGTQHDVQGLSRRINGYHADHHRRPGYEHMGHVRNRESTPLLVNHPDTLGQSHFFSTESEGYLGNSGSISVHGRHQLPYDLHMQKGTTASPAFLNMLEPKDKFPGQNFAQNGAMGIPSLATTFEVNRSMHHHPPIVDSSRNQGHFPSHVVPTLEMEHRNQTLPWSSMVEQRLGNGVQLGTHGAGYESHGIMGPLHPPDITPGPTTNAGLMETRVEGFSQLNTSLNPFLAQMNPHNALGLPRPARVNSALNSTHVNPVVPHLDGNPLMMTHLPHLQRSGQEAACSLKHLECSQCPQRNLRRDRVPCDQGHPGIEHPHENSMIPAAVVSHSPQNGPLVPQPPRAEYANHRPSRNDWVHSTTDYHAHPPPLPSRISEVQYQVLPVVENRHHLVGPRTLVDTGQLYAAQEKPVDHITTSLAQQQLTVPAPKRCRMTHPLQKFQEGMSLCIVHG